MPQARSHRAEKEGIWIGIGALLLDGAPCGLLGRPRASGAAGCARAPRLRRSASRELASRLSPRDRARRDHPGVRCAVDAGRGARGPSRSETRPQAVCGRRRPAGQTQATGEPGLHGPHRRRLWPFRRRGAHPEVGGGPRPRAASGLPGARERGAQDAGLSGSGRRVGPTVAGGDPARRAGRTHHRAIVLSGGAAGGGGSRSAGAAGHPGSQTKRLPPLARAERGHGPLAAPSGATPGRRGTVSKSGGSGGSLDRQRARRHPPAHVLGRVGDHLGLPGPRSPYPGRGTRGRRFSPGGTAGCAGALPGGG